VRNVYVHTPYYVNAASPDERTWHFSKTYILRELELMDRINARYFVMHVGSHTGAGAKIGKERVIRMLTEVLAESPKSNVVVCLENTAGQGNEVGSRLEDLGEVLQPFRKNKRIGAVIDTCHIFSAGYDLRTPEAVAKTFGQVEKMVGWERVPMLHFNDSKVGLGGHRDRHEHLGKGHIALDGLAAVINSPYIRGKDLILETEPEGRAPDIAWLKKTVAKTK
jgi:deoxyribonuclease-4